MASMITEGHYKAVVENPEIAASTKSNTPCVHATVRITEDGPHKGLRIAWEGWLTDGAAKRTIQSMVYAGCTFPPIDGEEEPNLEDFTGCGTQEVSVTIEIEEYTPEPTEANPEPKTSRRPRVGFINPLGAGRATKKIDDNQKKLIRKQFGGFIKSVFDERSKSAAATDNATEFDPKKLDGKDEKKKKKEKLY